MLITTVVTLVLSVYAFRQREVRGALPFSVCVLLASIWAGAYALEIAAVDLNTKLIFTNLQCIGYTLAPVTWIIMVCRFVERDRWINLRNITLLSIPPVIAIVLAWTNQFHNLMWHDVYLKDNGWFVELHKSFGPGFAMIALYSYTLNAVAELMLILSLRRKSSLYRHQSLVLLIGLALLFIPNLLYIFNVYPFNRLDLTSVVTGLSVVVIAFSVFRYRLFDIVPVARENIIENMVDGLIIVDTSGRIADINPAAGRLFGISERRSVSRPIATCLKQWPAIVGLCLNPPVIPVEMELEFGGKHQSLEVTCLSLTDKRGASNGLTLMFHDITERSATRAQLLEQERALAISGERDRLSRDLHDSVTQSLYGLSALSEAAEAYLESDNRLKTGQTLVRIGETARQALKEMRLFLYQLHPPELEYRGLLSALQFRLAAVEGRSGVLTRINVNEDVTLPAEIEKHLYQIAQEALNNTLKHARAHSVTIKIYRDKNAVVMEITDDGRGFESGLVPPGGMGLTSMRKRTLEIGGQIEIISAPTRGTTIKVKFSS